MMYNVPQFIDIEDKVAGPLTWRQLGWLIAMGVVILIVFMVIGGTLAFVISVPVVLFFVALAFYRPNGMPLISYVMNAFFFLFRPKFMVWDRPVTEVSRSESPKRVDNDTSRRSKPVMAEDIRRVAEMIDQR